MALRLKLKANEKVVVNGAVIVNGDKRNMLTVSNFAQVIRERDILLEEKANTPVKRAYYRAQLMLLDPSKAESYKQSFLDDVNDLMDALHLEEIRQDLKDAIEHCRKGDYYKTLAALRPVLKYEAVLFAYANASKVQMVNESGLGE